MIFVLTIINNVNNICKNRAYQVELSHDYVLTMYLHSYTKKTENLSSV